MGDRASETRRTSSVADLIGAWSMEGAEPNTAELIGAWSMDGASELDGRIGSPSDAPAAATAERAHVCGTAYDVPILVKSPGDDDWLPLAEPRGEDSDPSDLARRLIGY
jgi:hypothetical protein